MMRIDKEKIRFLAQSSLLCALAIVFGIAESFLSPFLPIPGMKIGFANLIILISLYSLGTKATSAVSLVRVSVCAVFQGSLPGFLYSLSGALFSLIVMILLKKLFSASYIWIVSVFGALGHTLAQLLVAAFLLGSDFVIFYAPILFAAAIVSGAVIGICADAIIRQISRIRQNLEKNQKKS